ncbi:MAG: hypoxanthine phosphoribosyltransferase [Desulfonatronovibrionaceae bacterium]
MDMQTILSRKGLQKRVTELAAEISRDYKGKNVLVLCVLKGAFIFCADLVRAMSIDADVDFIRLSSYGDKTFSSGKVEMSRDMETPVQNRHILIVEDIVDTGYSMLFLKDFLKQRHALSVKICALIDKHERRQVSLKVDYPGFVLQKGFLVGYGLDYAEKYRNLPEVCELIQH